MQKRNIIRVLQLLIIIVFSILTSCTIDKTDYEEETSTEVPEYVDFETVISSTIEGYNINIEALNGKLYKGYNAIRLSIINTKTNEELNNSEVSFLPIITNQEGKKQSCPHKYNLAYNKAGNYYSGYSVFTTNSTTNAFWQLYISFNDKGQSYTVTQDIFVEEQTNKNLGMTAFTGHDGEQYYIALIAPQKPKAAENKLIAGIYKYNTFNSSSKPLPDPMAFSYSEVTGFTLKLDPRMPDPSMGNHSSPNNKDLTQQSDKLYHGVVNYTMTGNWTLNFILLDTNNNVIKGTDVPTDFTPGVEGAKSELYIDVLF